MLDQDRYSEVSRFESVDEVGNDHITSLHNKFIACQQSGIIFDAGDDLGDKGKTYQKFLKQIVDVACSYFSVCDPWRDEVLKLCQTAFRLFMILL